MTPASGLPAESRPASGLPAESRPASGLPAESRPASGLPAESRPASGLPAESRPASGLPAESRPASGLPAESRPASGLPADIAARLKHNDAGLFSAVAQERSTGDVLMVAWMDDEALSRTLATRKGTYFSRSRGDYWVKGETSGHTQYVHEVRLDCDGDTVLLIVDQEGAACHTGTHTCFDTDVLLAAEKP